MNLQNDDTGDLNRYRVQSRREIIGLLRNVGDSNQLVSMQANSGSDSVVTSILDVDEANSVLIIDCAPSATTNQRVLESSDISFETLLENIRILFYASHAESCTFNDRPALQIPIPDSMIRLQRREFFRVRTPVITPVRCSFLIPSDVPGTPPVSAAVPLHNISGGGIAITDEKELIAPHIGKLHKDCRIELPTGAVVVSLEIRNSYSLKLGNGKTVRRIGMMFIDPPKASMVAIERYITKLQREQNTRDAGRD